MASTVPVLLHLLIRVGDSDEAHEIGTAEIDCVMEAVEPTDGATATAEYRITSFDLPGALRDAADAIEAAAS
ncbi:hypothetical protein SEA_KOZIE_6 [Microbacterium phage Kozie]|uniref:Uncharacterized protein n=1 Tax=Microbacterium phage Kozie TaxID=2885981 RepID=A0AAE9C350_9CAUD|nr:hypothetical protein QC998_gp06 [Microbacterium phage Kozie]UDL16202.1 hypothetical protein SEA_KOZIE_6 [Microbacterium phage Kozie]